MTTFRSACHICGLSLREVAEYLDVSHDTAKAWSQGRNAPPWGVWRDLAELYTRIENAADVAADTLEPGGMTLRVANDVQADDGNDPLPGGGADVAGAMALLLAVRDADDTSANRPPSLAGR